MKQCRDLRRTQHGDSSWRRFWQDNAAWLQDPFRTARSAPGADSGQPYASALVGRTEAARHTDTVLSGELIGQRTRELFEGSLTFWLLSGYHDLTSSQPLERAQFFAGISNWLAASGILD